MNPKERRRHFLINRPLQLRYMLTLTGALLLVTLVSIVSLYLGIWGGILDAFSDEKIQNDLLTASRIQQYEEARQTEVQPPEALSALSFVRQAERLSERQREIFKGILDDTNQKLVGKLLLLLALIAWGTIFLSHKIAGPLYRFQIIFSTLKEGDFSVRCHLRKFDEAKSVAETLNQTLEFLDQQFRRLKTIVREDKNNHDRLVRRLDEELSKLKTGSD